MAYQRRGSDIKPQRRILWTQTVGNFGESKMDREEVPSSFVEIAPILRVANEYRCHQDQEVMQQWKSYNQTSATASETRLHD